MKKNTILRVLAAVLALVLLLPVTGVLTADPVAADTSTADKVKEYEEQVKAIQALIAAQKKKLAAAQNNLNSAQEQTAYLEELKKTIEQSVVQYELLIAALDEAAQSLTDSIAEDEAALEKTFNQFLARVRASYEDGGGSSYLAMLLGATNLSDFLTRWNYATSILAYDRKLMASYRAEKEALKQKQAELQASIALKQQNLVTLEEQRKEVAEMQEDAILYLNKMLQQYNQTKDEYGQMNEELDEANKYLEEWLKKLAEEDKNKYSGEGMIWPLPGFPRITSYYGPRTYTYQGKQISDFHLGIDISGSGVYGASIVAVASGTVVTATEHKSYGNYVVINHGGGITTVYAHASKLLVKKGDTVQQGQAIALVGSTGQSTGAHLHFEVRVNGKTQNPLGSEKDHTPAYVIQPKY